jgi:uncharacterized protein YgiM (DUF1202 family)
MIRSRTRLLAVCTIYFAFTFFGVVHVRLLYAQATPPGSSASTPEAGSIAQAVVRVAALNVRNGPGANYSIQEVVRQNDSLHVTGRYGNCAWLQVSTAQGKAGWVSGASQYVTLNLPCTDLPEIDFAAQASTATPTPSLPPESTSPSTPVNRSGLAPIAVVQVATLNVRNGPGTNYAILYVVHQGDELQVVGQSSDCRWLKIIVPAEQSNQGQIGWVSGQSQFVAVNTPCSAITVESAEPSESTSSTSGPTGKLNGRVFRSNTNEPIPNAIIELNDTALDSVNPAYKVAETTSDQQGFYAFDTVRPGDYVLEVTMELERKSDGPCPVSTGLFFYRDADLNDLLFVLIGQESDGDSVLITGGFGIRVNANELVQRDLDLYCSKED